LARYRPPTSGIIHFGTPTVSYAAAVILASVAGLVRVILMRRGYIQAPFVLFYPAVLVAAFLGGAGPGFAALATSALFGLFLFSAFPNAFSWIILASLGSVISLAFAHLRSIRNDSVAMTRALDRFRFVSDHVSDWIFLTGPAGTIDYINQTACRDLGWSAAEMDGRQLEELLPRSQRPEFKDSLIRCTPGAAVASEVTFQRRDGSLVTVEARLTGVRVAENEVIHIAARDVRERRLVEEKLREARHWESMGALAGGLAHDFNNLLTSILGYASLVRATLPEEHSVVPLIENIENAGERSAELVRLMLATAGYRPRFRERLRVDEILARILDQQPVPAHIHLTSTVEVEGFAGDERSIETLLCSLLSNAIESYGEASGEVSLSIISRTAPDSETGDFEEGTLPEAECLGIIVEDYGCGIEPAVLTKAFDPFFSTKFTGRGLGLPAVRGIVRAYAGRLWIRTKPGEGTRVEVWLPITD
jgi:PAS domain S-box-containing protein